MPSLGVLRHSSNASLSTRALVSDDVQVLTAFSIRLLLCA